MIQLLALALEPNRSIWHDPFALRRPHCPNNNNQTPFPPLIEKSRLTSTTQVCLPRLAELAFPTFGRIQRDDMISDLDVVHSLTDRFDYPSTFVSQYRGELAFWIRAREGVCVPTASGSALSSQPLVRKF